MKTKKNIETEIIINTSKNEIWKVLVDLKNHENWNPFMIKSEGEAKVGTRLKNTMKNGEKEMVFKPKVLVSEINEHFEWLGHLFIPGLFDGRHYFKLETVEAGKTKLIHGEYFSGLLSSIILKSIRENTKQGFIAMNEALKRKVEQNQLS